MKRRADLTPEEQLWQQVWRVWPEAMQYEQLETPFDGSLRRATRALLRRAGKRSVA